MRLIIILLLVINTLFGIKLTKSGDFVIDDHNKLMWQDSFINVNKRLTHQEAIEYCKKLNINGITNWRLPTVEEYKLIIDKRRVTKQIMIHRAFKYVIQDDYWANDRTWLRNFGQYGYYILVKSGSIYYQNRSYKKFVRCIRDIK